MSKGNILLSFKGNIEPKLLSSILDIMEKKLTNINEPSKIKKKIYNVLVECLQNLYHHIGSTSVIDVNQEKLEENEKSAIFMVGKDDDCYKIFTGNQIPTDDVEGLKLKIDKVNTLNKTDLKSYYQDILNNGEMSLKGGGGLGLIDIARKSGNKLNYSFQKLDDEISFFTLEIKISLN